LVPSGDSGLDVPDLALLVDHIAEPIFVKDRNFRFVLVNAALCELVGHPRERLLGRTDYDFFRKEEADAFRAKDEEAFASATPVVVEEEPITDASGRRRVLATTKVPMRGPGGAITHLIGILHDITRLKSAEDALRRSNEELESRVRERTSALEAAQHDLVRKERLAVLGQLAGGIAHQIRNPLGSIKNAAYVIDRHLPGARDDDLRTALRVIFDEVDRANRIITDLLDYARMREPVRRPTPVLALFERALAASQVPDKIAVTVRADGCPDVLVDPGQVEGALFNLIRNAAEAMPEGGELVLDARSNGDVAVLGVRDTGKGVPRQQQAHLFEPLYTTKLLGLGLGLVTARTLIEGQGGSIVCSETGPQGTRFEVRLPTGGTPSTS
jgi:PAS domain S-box-containing protein